MNYKQFLGINEAKLGNYKYKIPSDKSELLFDFYMSTLLQPTGDDDLDYALTDMKEKLYPYLKQELLDVVLYAISVELRHVGDKVTPDNIERYSKVKNYDFLELWVDELEDQDVDSRQEAFDLLKKLIPDEKSRVENIKSLYEEKVLWDKGYGGKSWVQICDGWLNLNKTVDLKSMVVWIDHVYDLHHNTDTVFNKVNEYVKDGDYKWIQTALELKKHIKEPFDLYENVSASMKKLASYVIKKNFNQTFEEWAK